MIKVLFVCHGNICRSPMAEFVLKDKLNSLGIHDYLVESAATSYEEIGNGVYPPIKKLLNSKNISTKGKTARHLELSDYDNYDYIIGMDTANLRYMLNYFPLHDKLSKLTDDDVADPWYTERYNDCYLHIQRGCDELINRILK